MRVRYVARCIAVHTCQHFEREFEVSNSVFAVWLTEVQLREGARMLMDHIRAISPHTCSVSGMEGKLRGFLN